MATQIAVEKIDNLPAKLGYSMPAEWDRHESTWLSWPHNKETWPGDRLKRVEETYLQMLEALLPHEIVHLLVPNEATEDVVRSLLKKRDGEVTNLRLHLVPTVDTWIRDYGPTFVKNSRNQKAWCKWIFNAWGGKYPELAEDTQVFVRHKEIVGHSYFDAGFILEGGSIEVNGQGSCITTEQCLLNPNRNAPWVRSDIEKKLKDYLGVSDILWLKEGIVGDDTDGHIDDIVRFVSEKTLVAAFEEDPTDENYSILKQNWDKLKRLTQDRGWELIKLPMPGKWMSEDRDRLPASYANFYIANKVVLLPIYQHRNDDRAEKILRELFPKRTLVTIESSDLVYGLGSIHCVTQQEPA